MNITLAAEQLFSIWGISISNAVFTAFIIAGVITIFSIYMRLKLSYNNPGKFQVLIELMLDTLYGMVNDVMEPKYARKFFGFVMTFFFFILFSNWFGLLPIVPSLSIEHKTEEHVTQAVEESHGSFQIIEKAKASGSEELNSEESDEVLHEKFNLLNCLRSQHCYLTTSGVKQFHESTHVLRAPTSDLSMAIALAIISVLATNFLGFYYMKGAYLSKYINFSNPINGFVGILEIISEVGKIISFSFRLFGNVFAGEVLLAVLTSISFGVVTLPFLLLELFVGAIQAFVFFILTSVFIGLALSHHH